MPSSLTTIRRAQRLVLAVLFLASVWVLASAVPGWSQQPHRSAQPRASSDGGGSRTSAPSSAGRSGQSRSSGSGGGYSGRSHRPTGTGGHKSGSGRRSGYGYGYGHNSGYYHGGYGWSRSFSWPYYWGYPYYGHWRSSYPYYYYPAYSGYVVAGSGYATQPVAVGAVELEIKPKKAQVYVDGRYVGQAKNFDGYPNYLWLEQGSHTIELYMSGYQNLVRPVEVVGDRILEVHDRMIDGQAVLPDPPVELRPTTDRPARSVDESAERAPALRAPPSTPAAEHDRQANDLRGEPARLELTVRPEEASVYLNGRFLGSGRELANLRAPLIIDGGEHVLQVVHPDYRTEKREFSASTGEELELEVELGSGDEA